MRINLPSRIESKYGVFMIDATGLNKEREKTVIDLLNGSIEKGIIREFDKVGERYVVLLNKDKKGDVDLLKDAMGKDLDTVDAREDWFALTSSIGVLYVDGNMRRAIEKANRPLNSNALMAGANTALSKAKEENLMPKDHQRKKGNRVVVMGTDSEHPLDIKEWFHGVAEGVSSIFNDISEMPGGTEKKSLTQEAIEMEFKDEEKNNIPKAHCDNQVPLVYNYESFRKKMGRDPRGALFSLEPLWTDIEGIFDRAANEAEGVHKGRSFLKDWYVFGMLNAVLKGLMYDADWAIKVFGYIVNEQARKKFGDNFEVVIARAPPGQSPDRFLIWLRPKAGGEFSKEDLDNIVKNDIGKFLKSVSEEISAKTILKVSLQATVVPVNPDPDNIGETFKILDELARLYVKLIKSAEDKMDKVVADKFEGSFLEEDGKNVIITDDDHRIVLYDKESVEQKKAGLKFSGLKQGYAIAYLIDSLSKTKENYIRTLRRLYREARDMKADLDEAINAIPDDKPISEASYLIINEIKQKRLVNLVADSLGEYRALMDKVSLASATEQTIAISLDAITYEEGRALFDTVYALREAMRLGAKIVLVSFREGVDVKEFLKAQGIPRHLLDKIEVLGKAEFFEKYKDSANLTLLIPNSEYDLEGIEDRMPYKILKTRQLEESDVPSLLRALSSIMAQEAISDDRTIPIYTSLEAVKVIREKL